MKNKKRAKPWGCNTHTHTHTHKYSLKNNKAITLVALIITIIVLLILVAVTINMVLDENALFNKTKISVAKYQNAQERENSALAVYENDMEKYNSANRDNEKIKQLEEEIERLQQNRVDLNELQLVADYTEENNLDRKASVSKTFNIEENQIYYIFRRLCIYWK